MTYDASKERYTFDGLHDGYVSGKYNFVKYYINGKTYVHAFTPISIRDGEMMLKNYGFSMNKTHIVIGNDEKVPTLSFWYHLVKNMNYYAPKYFGEGVCPTIDFDDDLISLQYDSKCDHIRGFISKLKAYEIDLIKRILVN